MKQSSRLGSFACLLVLHVSTATASRAAILAGPITNAANGHIYYLLSPTNWPSAEAEAVSLHGHLATINDVAENTWVFNRFGANGGVARSLWLGLNDAAQEGNWVWVSGESATYRNWAPGEPNNGGGFYPNEDQAVMRGPALDYSDSWNDAPGEQIHAAVVEVVVGSPQTNDLWDVNQGVIVTASSPFDAAFGSPHPYDARDLLGGTFGDYLPEQGSVVFNDGQPAGFVHFVEWRTPSPVTVGSFKLYAFGSADPTIKREFTSFKLRAKSPGSAVFDSVLCEFSPQHPYVFEDERSYLLLSRTISLVTAQDFRAEFTDMGNSPFSGPRIVELDGFPPEAPPPQTNSISAHSDFSTNSNPNGVWSYGYSTILGAPMTLFSERGKWAGLDYWRAPALLGVPGVYRNPANFTVTNGTGTAVLGPGQLSFYPGPNGEFCVIRFAAPAKGSYQVSGAFTGVDPHGTFTDVHILVNGVIFNGSVTGFGAGSGPTFNLIVNLNSGDPIDFVVGRSANTQFSFDSTGLSVQIVPPIVGIPPTITSQPQSRIVNSGTNVTFSVTATGTAPLSYQWRRNETNLAGATGPSLTLSNVQPANAGIYSVRVTNAFGAATSSNAVLTVLPASTNCVAPPPGLVSWWRAENPGVGANTVLDSADANHGTLVGNAGYGAGRIGQALVLDGNGDGVRIGNPTNLQLQNFTIEAWIKRSSSSVVSFSLGGLWAEFFCYGTGGYAFGLLNNGQLFLSKVDIDQTQTPVGIGITDTNFHHVAVTKSGSVVVFYIDGAAYPVTPYNTTYTFTSPTAIGVRGDNLSSSFYGAIDELAVYNRALTSAEIQGVYTAGTAGKCPSTAGIPPTITSQPQSRTVNAGTNITFFVTATGTAPLNYQWRRNETNLPGATGPSLTLSNVQPANAGGYSVRVTNAFGAVTSSNAVLTVLPPSSPILAGPITNPANGHVYFLIASNTWTGAEAHAVTLGGHLVTINDAAENAWVLSTFGSFGGVARPLWIGLNDAAQEGAFVWVSGEAATYRNWMPGEPNNGGGFVPDEDYVGMRGPGLSFSNAWNDTLNSDLYVGVVEIGAAGSSNNCVSAPTGLVSWWRAESNPFDAVDGNSGILSEGVSFIPGKVGQAFRFNGTNAQVRVPASASLNVGLGGGFTIETWINPAQLTSQRPLVEWNDGSTYGVHLWLFAWPNFEDGRALYLNVVDTSSQNHGIYAAAGTITTNGYQHVAATYNKTNGVAALYINGTMVVQQALGVFAPRTAGDLYFGFRPAGPSAGTRYIGAMDEVSIYNRPLGSNEIAGIFAAGSAGKCPLSGGIAPTITSQPQSRTVNAGTNVTFFVSATGTTPLSYQWRRNETNLPGATGASLTLSNVQPANVGSYSVRVTNAFGAVVSSNAALIVLASGTNCVAPAPGLISWWRAQGNANDATDGNNGTLSAGMSFVPGKVGQAFHFEGTNANVRVPASTSLNVGLGGGFTIETWINPAQLTSQRPLVEWNDGSSYGVHLWLFAWPNFEDGRALYLNVVDTSSQNHGIYTAAGTITTNGYQHVAATYNKTNGVAALYINGTMVVQQALGVLAPRTTGDLFFGFRPAGPSAGTRYIGAMDEIAIYNRPLGSNEIAGIFAAGSAGKCPPSGGLPPTITSQPQSRTVNTGTTVTFFVTATGTTPLSYQWRRNETNLPGATGTSLTLSNVQPNNAGTYSVRVTNAFGAVTSSNAVLTVLSAGPGLVIISQPQSQTVNAGTNVTFFVVAASPTQLSFQWRHNETNLPGASSGSLTLSNVQPANGGNYSVRLDNATGAVISSDAVLTVLSPPAPILAGPITNPANGHVYFLIASNTWTGAEAHAVTLGGHLVTINDAAENAWVLSTFGGFNGVPRPLWIGLNDAALEGAFVWVSGEAATYRNWMPGEPNSGGGFVPDEDYVAIRGPGLSFSNAWNDTLNSNLYVGVVEISPFGPGINCAIPPAGLVSWWRAEGNANDSVGTNNGTTPFEMVYAAGEVGQAFDFNGTSRRVSVPDSPNFKLTNAFTVEGWIYARQSNSGIIFIRGDNRYGLDPIILTMLKSPGNVDFRIDNAEGQSIELQAPVQLTQWQHIAATLDGTNGNMTLYVNGVVRAQTNTTIRPLANLDPSQQPTIGIGNHGGTTHQFPFNGLIDEISLYSRALSQNEIGAIYHAGSNGKCINRPPIAGAGRLTSVVCDPGTKAKLCFAGVAGNTYTVQASTNLIDWEVVGVSVAGPNGVCEFEDADSTRFPCRYYRVILPRPTRSSREPDKQAARVHVE